MGRNLVRSILALLFVFMLAGTAGAQQTTGVIRGSVNATDGQAIGTVEVTAANTATGVRTTTLTTAGGSYVFPSVPVGTYDVEARRIGYRAQVRQGIRVTLASTQLINFVLEVGAAELAPISVSVDQGLIDPDQSGVVDLVTAEQVAAIPVPGRNFADLIALSPKVGVDSGDGTGGNISLGGGRRGANLIQIDGAGSTGTFFGGEARGSDRIPFAFSIESVEEFQVVSNGFDVEFGFFSGGVINAVTKSGTNEFHGSAFGYFRDGALTRADFFGRESNFSSQQLGLTLSGPIVRDKVHFYLAVERQDRDQPVFGLPAPGSTPDPRLRAHPDSVARFLDILSRVYGVEDFAGEVVQTQDETTVFGRIDWQLSNNHRLTIRHNFTDLQQEGDRISSNETILNGGVFENTGNSTVVSLTSILSPTVWNEARAQYATEPRPREASTELPQIEVFLNGCFGVDNGDGTCGAGVEREFLDFEALNDPVLPNNLEETTFEFINNLHWATGNHDLKFGVHFNNFSYLNFFFFNQFGEFEFEDSGDRGTPTFVSALSNLENQIGDDFSRNLPFPGPDGLFNTADDVTPLADYSTREFGFYVQDTWHPSDRLSITSGLRYDITTLPDKAPLNEDLESSLLGLRTDIAPGDKNLSPRLSFTYDPTGEGNAQIRGGIGLFFGRFPSVLYSNSLLNTGANQVFLNCSNSSPFPDYASFAADPTTIPTACAGSGFAFSPNVNVFAEDFEYPRTWKASFGVDREVGTGLTLSGDVLFSTTSQNFSVQNANILPEQFRSAVEDRPVSVPFDRMRSSGGFSFGRNLVERFAFNDALVHVSNAEARSWQLSLGLNKRMTNWLSWQFGYTFNDARDNSSYSCCISSTAIFETPTAGNVNELGDPGDERVGSWGPADFQRTHTFVLSGIADLPAGFQVSGIWRTFSGRPWTPMVDGDVNGDGEDDNDRAYILDVNDP
ncbi:MAG: TonB-dependent receptor domain-containing protein, partial [Gemmatimonadota bacterium]